MRCRCPSWWRCSAVAFVVFVVVVVAVVGVAVVVVVAFAVPPVARGDDLAVSVGMLEIVGQRRLGKRLVWTGPWGIHQFQQDGM